MCGCCRDSLDVRSRPSVSDLEVAGSGVGAGVVTDGGSTSETSSKCESFGSDSLCKMIGGGSEVVEVRVLFSGNGGTGSTSAVTSKTAEGCADFSKMGLGGAKGTAPLLLLLCVLVNWMEAAISCPSSLSSDIPGRLP